MPPQKILMSGSTKLVFQPDQQTIRDAVSESGATKVFVLTDTNTKIHCFPLLDALLGNRSDIQLLELPAGEVNKNAKNLLKLLADLLDSYADRNALLINLGGGVICDMGGFAAAIYKRGISFINVPTSLLAMVDASVGGKTAIDFRGSKNQLGLFYSPESVFIDIEYLKTLPERHFRAALAEMLKHTLLYSEESLRFFMASDYTDNKQLEALIFTSVRFKNSIVQQDFRESGVRKQLNLGHTFGHALESYFLDKPNAIYHGEAVAAGMICDLYLSVKRRRFSQQVFEMVVEWIKLQYRLPVPPQEAYKELFTLMQHDKKNHNGEVITVLLSSPGSPWLDRNLSFEEVKEALDFYAKIIGS